MIGRQKHNELACLDAFDPPYELNMPTEMSAPILFCSPHAGRIYPDALLEMSRLSEHSLRRNEDAYIDQLFAHVSELGAPLLSANFPRCFVDVNRAADELPSKWRDKPGEPTLRAKLGLGVVPTAIAEQTPIYKRGLRAAQVQMRLEKLYHPYHAILKHMCELIRETFGWCLIVDCHSMPGFTQSGQRRADIVLGDRYGTSCTPETMLAVEHAFKSAGYSVVRNHPYAGSHTTSHYGRPHEQIDAIQIEINRDLYLDPETLTPKSGFDALLTDLKLIVADILLYAQRPNALAAE